MPEPTDIFGKVGKKVGEEIKIVQVSLGNHKADVSNPHAVTQTQVGLGNVENTALSTWAGSANITTVGTLATGTIPYSLLSGVPDLNSITGDLTIGGDLTVNGTNTILNTQTLEVEDNEIELNLGTSGAETAQTSGISINRGIGTGGITPATGFVMGTITTSTGTDFVESVVVTVPTGHASGANAGTYTFTNSDPVNASNNIYLVAGKYWQGMYENTDNQDLAFDLDDSQNKMDLSEQNSGSVGLAFTWTDGTSGAEDKAKLQWNDTSSKWTFLVGTAKADLEVDTLTANVVAVPDKDGITINNVSLGDYAEFETAFDDAMA